MKHIKRIDWPTLREWCLAHGAKNDSILSIEIKGRGENFNVVLEGFERDHTGRHFVEGLSNQIARWRTVEPLRSLP